MPAEFKKIILSDSLSEVASSNMEAYLAHALCCGGSAAFDFNGNHFSLGEHDLLIVRRGNLLTNLSASPDFKVKVIYIHRSFIEHSTPQSNYGMTGQLALFLNPVMHLTPGQFQMCRMDFETLEMRLGMDHSPFYLEFLRCSVQLLILDFFDFHASLTNSGSLPGQATELMTRFFSLLETGIYRSRRDVGYFASELCVTPKYLSEICKKASGHSASFWINRYTSLDLSRILRDKSYSLSQIADMFNFSSTAYFSRYVQHNLGMSPSDYRD